MNISLGIMGPTGVIGVSMVYALITLTALYFVIKNEKSTSLFIWILLILLFPVIGGLIYLAKHFLNRKESLQ